MRSQFLDNGGTTAPLELGQQRSPRIEVTVSGPHRVPFLNGRLFPGQHSATRFFFCPAGCVLLLLSFTGSANLWAQSLVPATVGPRESLQQPNRSQTPTSPDLPTNPPTSPPQLGNPNAAGNAAATATTAAAADDKGSFNAQASFTTPLKTRTTPSTAGTGGSSSPLGEAFEPSRVLAIVAGQPILAGEQLVMINEIIQTQAADAPPFVREKMLEQGMRELLPRSIERKMLYQEALLQLPATAKLEDIKKDLYKQVEEKQLPQLLKKYQANNLGELDARLRSLGGSWRAVREQIVETEIGKFAVTSQMNIDEDVTYDQLIRRYMQNRENYRVEEQVRWEHLMVSFSKTPDRGEAKRKLVSMGNEVIYGAPLAEVAKRSSDDFFAAQGGYNDWTKRNSLTNRQLEDRVFSEPVGRLSDIIETSLGYHIIRVIERQEAGIIPFTELQDKLREEILNERQSQALQRIIAKIRNRIPYEIYLEGVEF